MRSFAFVDLSGFTSFSDEHGDEESVLVLTEFRHAARRVATDFGVRIAKWLGDGAMFVAVDARQLVCGVLELARIIQELDLPLEIHAGMAGGAVILLEGDDYTGGPVNLASRLADAAGPSEILATPQLAALAPAETHVDHRPAMLLPGLVNAVEAIRLAPITDDTAQPGPPPRARVQSSQP
jgi:class 3 adenylate cyclase